MAVTLLQPGRLLRPAPPAGIPGWRAPEPGEVPLEYITDWVRSRLPALGGPRAPAPADRVLAVRARTGSGKSTALPVALLRLLRPRASRGRYRGPGVLCTQPRVLTARTLATKEVAGQPYNPDMVLGETVGYQTGPMSFRPAGGLVFATIGVLGAQLAAMTPQQVRDRYRFIIVDEAHERSAEADVALAALREFLLRSCADGAASTPFVLLTSATFDPDDAAAYFGAPGNVVDVEGQTQPILSHYALAPAPAAGGFPRAAADRLAAIVAQGRGDPPGRGDALVFLPGGAEIRAAAEAMAGMGALVLDPGGAALDGAIEGGAARVAAASDDPADDGSIGDPATDPADDGSVGDPADDSAGAHEGGAAEGLAGTLVLRLDRAAVNQEGAEFRLAFAPPGTLPRGPGAARGPPPRRAILSTVVAETGVTLDTLRYVLDCGWQRETVRFQPEGVGGLVTLPAARSRVAQRRGRCGRKFPGDFHALYTEAAYDALEADQLPAVVSEGIEDQLPLIALLHERAHPGEPFRFAGVPLRTVPPEAARMGAVDAATLCGALAPGSAALTATGRLAARLRCGLRGARLLVAAAARGCSLADAATAAAALGQRAAFLCAHGPGIPPAGLPAAAAAVAPPALAGVGGEAPAQAGARVRRLLGDDLAEAVLAVSAAADRLRAGGPAAARAWAEAGGLSYDAILEFAEARAELLDEAFAAGLDYLASPAEQFGDLYHEPPGRFFQALAALKAAFADALRGNELELDAAASAGGWPVYRTRFGRTVSLSPTLTGAFSPRPPTAAGSPRPGLRPDGGTAASRRLAPDSGSDLSQTGGARGGAVALPRLVVATAVILVPDRVPAGARKVPVHRYHLEARAACVLDGFCPADLALRVPAPTAPAPPLPPPARAPGSARAGGGDWPGAAQNGAAQNGAWVGPGGPGMGRLAAYDWALAIARPPAPHPLLAAGPGPLPVLLGDPSARDSLRRLAEALGCDPPGPDQ